MAEEWNFAWVPESELPGRDRQALKIAAKWGGGVAVSISFLDGDPVVRDRVREVAGEWLSRTGANLRFSWRADTTDTLVRISFRGRGRWSVIGTGCKQRPPGRPTMNLGGLTKASPDAEVRRATLHEFGHVLGMVHEHSLADAGIEWNHAAVYADLEDGWSRAEIDANIFAVAAAGEHNTAAFDRNSIMVYPIKPHWTRNGFSSDYNLDLSPNDIAFIRSQYPDP